MVRVFRLSSRDIILAFTILGDATVATTMAIFRCKRCAFLQELSDGQVGTTTNCPKCAATGPVHDTTTFVAKLLGMYFEARKTIAALKPAEGDNKTASAIASPDIPDTLDLFNTDAFSSELQHGPIVNWFRKRRIHVEANLSGVDTTGFFDEVAVSIGHNRALLQDVIDRIRWAQQKDYASTTILLAQKSAEEAKELMAFCQQLYDFSLITKCVHNRKDNKILLVLQPAPAVRRFFDGEWLEWYALMMSLTYCRERKRRFSCARNLRLTLQNGDKFELDVFLLVDGELPVCIECKTGEFRQDIEKYLTLRKAFGLEGRNIIMCATDLSDEHAKGLTAMYGLSFANENSLMDKLARLF